MSEKTYQKKDLEDLIIQKACETSELIYEIKKKDSEISKAAKHISKLENEIKFNNEKK